MATNTTLKVKPVTDKTWDEHGAKHLEAYPLKKNHPVTAIWDM